MTTPSRFTRREYHARIGEAERKFLGYGDGERMGPTWARPERIGAECTLAFRVIFHREAITRSHALAREERCFLIPPPVEGNFGGGVFRFTPTPPGEASWVGSRGMSSRFVGFVPAGEEFPTVVWHEDVAKEGSFKLPLEVKPLVGAVEDEGGRSSIVDVDRCPSSRATV